MDSNGSCFSGHVPTAVVGRNNYLAFRHHKQKTATVDHNLMELASWAVVHSRLSAKIRIMQALLY